MSFDYNVRKAIAAEFAKYPSITANNYIYPPPPNVSNKFGLMDVIQYLFDVNVRDFFNGIYADIYDIENLSEFGCNLYAAQLGLTLQVDKTNSGQYRFFGFVDPVLPLPTGDYRFGLDDSNATEQNSEVTQGFTNGGRYLIPFVLNLATKRKMIFAKLCANSLNLTYPNFLWFLSKMGIATGSSYNAKTITYNIPLSLYQYADLYINANPDAFPKVVGCNVVFNYT